VKNYKVLQRVKKERKIIYTIQRIKDNWIGHILHTNSLLRHVIEKKKVTGRRGRRSKQLLNDLKNILETKRQSTRSYSVEKLLWKRLWTCLKTGYKMVMVMMNGGE
jgi:hypothetical protein